LLFSKDHAMQLAEFEVLVAQLLSADNANRKQAEDVYEQLKAHPDGLLELLLLCLRQSPQVQNRQFCAIMLRKVPANCSLAPTAAVAYFCDVPV
jgi:hypothetical protein